MFCVQVLKLTISQLKKKLIDMHDVIYAKSSTKLAWQKSQYNSKFFRLSLKISGIIEFGESKVILHDL